MGVDPSGISGRFGLVETGRKTERDQVSNCISEEYFCERQACADPL
jgi:hypothetical protein